MLPLSATDEREDFLGLRFVSTFEIDEARGLHSFFEMHDGSCLAFFEVPGRPFDVKRQDTLDLHIPLGVDPDVNRRAFSTPIHTLLKWLDRIGLADVTRLPCTHCFRKTARDGTTIWPDNEPVSRPVREYLPTLDTALPAEAAAATIIADVGLLARNASPVFVASRPALAPN